MQVPPLPPVQIPPAAVSQESMARALPQAQAQASAPIIQRAVDPSGKSDRGDKSRSNSDRGKGGGEKDGRSTGSVDIRV